MKRKKVSWLKKLATKIIGVHDADYYLGYAFGYFIGFWGLLMFVWVEILLGKIP